MVPDNAPTAVVMAGKEAGTGAGANISIPHFTRIAVRSKLLCRNQQLFEAGRSGSQPLRDRVPGLWRRSDPT